MVRPFSADPKALAGRGAEGRRQRPSTFLYLLDEETITFERTAEAKIGVPRHRVHRPRRRVPRGAGTARPGPWYDDKPVITARVITKDGTVHTLDPKRSPSPPPKEEQDMFSDQRCCAHQLRRRAGAIVRESSHWKAQPDRRAAASTACSSPPETSPIRTAASRARRDASTPQRGSKKSGFEPVDD